LGGLHTSPVIAGKREAAVLENGYVLFVGNRKKDVWSKINRGKRCQKKIKSR
jgi:hypothetical protein